METFQSIVDMQLLAIEKTLLVADSTFHADMARDIEETVTQVSVQLGALMSRIQQSGSKVAMPAQHPLGRSLQRNGIKTRSFSNSWSSSTLRSRKKISVSNSADEHALRKFLRSLRCVARLQAKAAFTKWRAFCNHSVSHLDGQTEAFPSPGMDDSAEFEEMENDDGPATFSPTIYSAHDGQPVDMSSLQEQMFSHSSSGSPNVAHQYTWKSVYPSNTVVKASAFLPTHGVDETALSIPLAEETEIDNVDDLYAELVSAERSQPFRARGSSATGAQQGGRSQDILHSTRFLRQIPEVSPSWERHLQWNGGLGGAVELEP